MPNVFERVKIVVDGEVMSGDPCIEGTRIAAETIIMNLKAGHSFERILEAYPTLPPGGIEAEIVWADSKGIDLRH